MLGKEERKYKVEGSQTRPEKENMLGKETQMKLFPELSIINYVLN